jgi:hypothetical protein
MKLRHPNLLAYADKPEVYKALQQHFNRDTWRQGFWDLVFFGCALGAVFISHREDWLWLFGALYAAERALVAYIDNSNRNWFMHTIDWFDGAGKQHKQDWDSSN